MVETGKQPQISDVSYKILILEIKKIFYQIDLNHLTSSF